MERKKRVVPREVCVKPPKGVTTVQGNEAVLNTQKSAEVIVGIWTWKHGHANRRTESVGVLSMTEKGGMTVNGRKH